MNRLYLYNAGNIFVGCTHLAAQYRNGSEIQKLCFLGHPSGQCCNVVLFSMERHEQSCILCSCSSLLDAFLFCDCPCNSSCRFCIHILHILSNYHRLWTSLENLLVQMHSQLILLKGKYLDNSYHCSSQTFYLKKGCSIFKRCPKIKAEQCIYSAMH